MLLLIYVWAQLPNTLITTNGVLMSLNIYQDVAKNVDLIEYIDTNLYDSWQGTAFQGYRHLGSKQKGNYGESFVSKLFSLHNRRVEPGKENNGGHDRIIDGYLTEIKFSLAHTDHKKKCIKPNTFTMNHVSLEKDWERLVFVGINPEPHESYAKFITKQDFARLLNDETETFFKYFSRQQGGKKSTNDDYISSEAKLRKLLESEYMRDITEWLAE